jgi:hypothetical protein
MPSLITSTVGFPRIGPKREMKKALEDFWSKKSSEADLVAISHAVEAQAWTAQADAGVDLIALDGTYYDQILDTISYLGLIPERFNALSGLDRYFAAARGTTSSTALDMSKYFDTNYHQIVPELHADSIPVPDWSPLLDRVRHGQAVVGAAKAVPLLVGPLTFVALSRGEFDASEMTCRLVPAYVEALTELAKLGVPEVQVYTHSINKNIITPMHLLLLSYFLSPLYKLLHDRTEWVGVSFGEYLTLSSYIFLQFSIALRQRTKFASISRSRLLFFCCCYSYFLFSFVTRPLADMEGTPDFRRTIWFESRRALYDNSSYNKNKQENEFSCCRQSACLLFLFFNYFFL